MQKKAVGYAYLIERYGLGKSVLPLTVTSQIGARAYHREVGRYLYRQQVLVAQYQPEETLGEQLEFALKYEGTNLQALVQILRAAPKAEIIEYISSKQTGKYSRRIWFICEELAGIRLDELPDLKIGNYVPLLDPSDYVVCSERRSARHRVTNNLFGTTVCAPLIRKTERLSRLLATNYHAKMADILAKFSPDLLTRAVHFLYTKETKSSFEIEKEIPDIKRAARFVQVLRNAGKKNYLLKTNLIALQNEIVDPRFLDRDYRKSQSYIGETLQTLQERVHYICPKPEDVPTLMRNLPDMFEFGLQAETNPFLLAVIVSYLFVYVHPFEDGNGRIHRFLLHDLLHRTGFVPKDVVLPISATLLRNKPKYDEMLESFSEGLMELIPYDLDENGEMSISTPTLEYYRFIDLTFVAEGMFDILNETIEKDLHDELQYLATFDINMERLKEVVDLPDKKLNLFIRFCLSNGGRISKTKRRSYFPELTDQEVTRLEASLLKKE